MDAARFDALSRQLGYPRSRRSLLTRLAAVLGLVPATGHTSPRAPRRRFAAQGPCGDGSVHANTCQRHRDCCTRSCQRRSGRCRCRRRGQSCTQDRHCCRRDSQHLTCRQRKCRPLLPRPEITAFTATPATIDRGATPAERATLAWATREATTCAIDHEVGSVPCNGSVDVRPDATTTYPLSVTGAGGGPVTALATVTVEYCHSVTSGGSVCTTGNSQFCLAVPIEPTRSAHARAACEACFGTGANDLSCEAGGAVSAWQGPSGSNNRAFQYLASTAGTIVGGRGAFSPPECDESGSRWAP